MKTGSRESVTRLQAILRELGAVKDRLRKEGAKALIAGQYETAQLAVELTKNIEEFIETTTTLKRRWEDSLATAKRQPSERKGPVCTPLPEQKRTRHRTPEDAMRSPILEALVELGGSGTSKEVLALVEQKLRDRLTDLDYQPVPSNPKEPRWRNTARWCRYGLIQEGLLKPDSPRGIWGISESGLKALQEQGNASDRSSG